MGEVTSPMPLATDYEYPAQWAVASTQPWVGSPLQQDSNPTYPDGYSPPVKLPGLTTASGTVYAAAGVSLQAVAAEHTAVQVVPSKREIGVATFYNTFGDRNIGSNHTRNSRVGYTGGATLPTGSIQERFSKLPDPNTGQPANA